MTWSYRVIRHLTGVADDPEYYSIHEVYYDEYGKVRLWSDDFLAVGSTMEELSEDLAKMQKALVEPVLDEEDMP